MQIKIGHLAGDGARAVEHGRAKPDTVVHRAKQGNIAFSPLAFEISQIHRVLAGGTGQCNRSGKLLHGQPCCLKQGLIRTLAYKVSRPPARTLSFSSWYLLSP